MLILTRKIGESLMIGEDIVVTVLDIKGHTVRIGINAPSHVEIHREEIYAEKKKKDELPNDDLEK